MLPPASAAAVAVMPFSDPIWASIALASLIDEATPEGRPIQLDSCALAALRSAVSPPPPENAPDLRSTTNGQFEKIIGYPGAKTLTIIKAARVSASEAARNAAGRAGAVAPD